MHSLHIDMLFVDETCKDRKTKYPEGVLILHTYISQTLFPGYNGNLKKILISHTDREQTVPLEGMIDYNQLPGVQGKPWKDSVAPTACVGFSLYACADTQCDNPGHHSGNCAFHRVKDNTKPILLNTSDHVMQSSYPIGAGCIPLGTLKPGLPARFLVRLEDRSDVDYRDRNNDRGYEKGELYVQCTLLSPGMVTTTNMPKVLSIGKELFGAKKVQYYESRGPEDRNCTHYDSVHRTFRMVRSITSRLINEYLDGNNPRSPSIGRLRNKHVPRYFVSMLPFDIPSFLYLQQVPEDPLQLQYFEEALRCALYTRGVSERQFIDIVDKQFQNPDILSGDFLHKAVLVLNRMLCLYATHVTYTMDHTTVCINGRGEPILVDRNNDVFETRRGDCGDVAQNVYKVYLMLTYHLGSSAFRPRLSEALKRAVDLCQCYTALVAIAEVRTASASDIKKTSHGPKSWKEKLAEMRATERSVSSQNSVTHLYTVLVSIPEMAKRTGKSVENSALEFRPWRASNREDSGRWADKKVFGFERELPIIICEGTAWVYPLQKPFVSTYYRWSDIAAQETQWYKSQADQHQYLQTNGYNDLVHQRTHDCVRTEYPPMWYDAVNTEFLKDNEVLSAFYKRLSTMWTSVPFFNMQLAQGKSKPWTKDPKIKLCLHYSVTYRDSGKYGVRVEDVLGVGGGGEKADWYLDPAYTVTGPELAACRTVVQELHPLCAPGVPGEPSVDRFREQTMTEEQRNLLDTMDKLQADIQFKGDPRPPLVISVNVYEVQCYGFVEQLQKLIRRGKVQQLQYELFLLTPTTQVMVVRLSLNI